jgi:hypothetical protein
MTAVLALSMAAPWIGGCSFTSIETKSQSEPNVFPADYKPEIAAFLRMNLANPRKVRDAYIATPVLRTVGGQPRYVTCVRYNAQNIEYKYEGNKENLATFLGGRMNQFVDSDPQICPGLAYQRYPEIENMVP